MKKATDMALDKEVQNMLLQEKYVRMDWATHRHQAREEGFNEGFNKGRNEGLNDGRNEGRNEGLNEGITGTVKALRDYGVEDKRIAEKIKEIYNLTDENAEKYVEEALHSQTP